VERKRDVRVKVNGVTYEQAVEMRKTLAEFLREDLGLRGTHLGCEHGVCGACTVLMDGVSVRSCITYAVQVDGAEIMTVEGMAIPRKELHPIQEAFREHHGLQCGFCTPGFLITAFELLRDSQGLSENEIREQISGNLCRCTGYQGIVEAVRAADAKWER
jgi:aerobic-type carbon monoxide dehydrogenase small subunit (CoxS/CutS family)